MIPVRIGAATLDPHPPQPTPRSQAAPTECMITALFERLLVWATRNSR